MYYKKSIFFNLMVEGRIYNFFIIDIFKSQSLNLKISIELSRLIAKNHDVTFHNIKSLSNLINISPV
ncbi:unnamed protein product [Nezara viridula]|uniref:Uncharacterized protein n=1 Tax=Nezara viridula TaxID=85310 RepID=A0A9P0MWA8_NEZVI|nr:unnamed protein product [Nezara viridula]